jgi:exosortase D (VPLPA-CTERM-specific)
VSDFVVAAAPLKETDLEFFYPRCIEFSPSEDNNIMIMMPKLSPSTIIKTSALCLLLAGLYHSALTWLVVHDWARDDFSHAYVMPLVVLYMIWNDRGELARSPSKPSWFGLFPLVIGIGLFWLGELGGEYFTLYVSFWAVLIGLVWLHQGWGRIRILGFPLLMILMMFPPPRFLYNKISFSLQLISSRIGTALMQFYGMSAHRQGNIIDLGFAQLQVVDACSGLRSLMSLTVLGLVMAHFFKASLWKRAFLLASIAPLAVFFNSIRLTVTGVLYQTYGSKAAEGFFHGFSGWAIFVLALGTFLLEIRLLKRLPDKHHPPTTGNQAPSTKHRQPSTKHQAPGAGNEAPSTKHQAPPTKHQPPSTMVHKPFTVAILMLGATLALSQGINFREKIPPTQSLDGFPLQVGEWVGTRQYMNQAFIDDLDFSDYTIVDYRRRHGDIVNLYVAYYDSQRKGESIHSPETCLPGSGWNYKEAGNMTVPVPGYNPGYSRETMTVNRAYMEKQGQQQLVYYWFPQRGRILQSAYQLKLYTFWDALTKQRTDGALVRIITPVSEGEGPDDADARLSEFMRLVVPILAQYIPGEDL